MDLRGNYGSRGNGMISETMTEGRVGYVDESKGKGNEEEGDSGRHCFKVGELLKINSPNFPR